MTRAILIVAGTAAFIYVGLCIVLFLYQRSLIYFPQAGSAAEGADTLVLTVEHARVLANTRPHSGPDAVIYFGGNAEDVSRSLPTLEAAFPGRALYALNYRGYGGSTGKPSEAALISDALALFDRVHADHPHIVMIGRSLGSGVAVHVASARPVERLVLVTPYDSLLEIAAAQFPFFPVRWLLIDRFESWRYAAGVTAPTLLIAAENDDVIPRASTESLRRRFRASLATLRILARVDHNSISESHEYIPALQGTP
ncbi:MAG: alpha/beta fold hydrolase [Steroidobacteraceae bacterium]|jgi:pimeloyl-ACP methyl ester carboxylesterase